MKIRNFNSLQEALDAGFKIELGDGKYGRKDATYDTKCYDLAAAFLEDEPGLFTEGRNDELARLIQQTIEDYIASERSNYEPPDPPGFEAGFAKNH